MVKDRMYITVNRSMEWRRSLLVNLRQEGHRIIFAERQEAENEMMASGFLVTSSIDSAEKDFQWDNLLIDADLPENSGIKVSCFASDNREVSLDGGLVNLDDYIKNKEIEGTQKLRSLASVFKHAFAGEKDGIINAKGRYVWLRLEFLVPHPGKFCLRKIKLQLADEKIIQYLPEIYRDRIKSDDFFQRFMNIFDSLFFDLESKVSRIHERLDYQLASGDMLKYLAGWVSVNDAQQLGDEELRDRISGIIPECSVIGTKRGIEAFVEMELGVKPRIVEYFQFKRMIHEGRDREIYKELFGTNPYKFFIMLPENAFSRGININSFLEKLKNNIPAHTEAEIVLLKQGTILGKHTYLGINSMVGEYNYVSVDENIAISYDTLIGGNGNEK
jgi:phage tail-like protein